MRVARRTTKTMPYLSTYHGGSILDLYFIKESVVTTLLFIAFDITVVMDKVNLTSFTSRVLLMKLFFKDSSKKPVSVQ